MAEDLFVRKKNRRNPIFTHNSQVPSFVLSSLSYFKEEKCSINHNTKNKNKKVHAYTYRCHQPGKCLYFICSTKKKTEK